MSITENDAIGLKQAGFTNFEIEKLANATVNQFNNGSQGMIDINSPVWRSLMHSRREWVISEKKKGKSMEEIEQEIMEFYANSDRDIFDFLKAEYQSPVKSNYNDAMKARAQRKVNRLYKRRYW